MNVLKTAPVIEPNTLAELKLHLKLDSETFAGDIITYQSILPGSHAIANNFTTHAGTGVSVVGKTAIVNLNAGTVESGGTVDAKIQESDDNATWTDWTGGAVMQFSTINSDVCKAIGDLNSARLDEVKAVVNMVYLDELLNADHDRPMYFLRRFDDSIKTKNSDTIKEKDKT